MMVLEIYLDGQIVSSRTVEATFEELNREGIRVVRMTFPDGFTIQPGETLRATWAE